MPTSSVIIMVGKVSLDLCRRSWKTPSIRTPTRFSKIPHLQFLINLKSRLVNMRSVAKIKKSQLDLYDFDVFSSKRLKIVLEQQISTFFDEILGIDLSQNARFWIATDDFCDREIG